MSLYLFPLLLCASFAMLYEMCLVRWGRYSYGVSLLILALFAGLRYQVGQDWPAYKEYFENIENFEYRFEVGFYFLNCLIRSAGGSYSAVFLIVALCLSFSIYHLTAKHRLNLFYILTIYIGYSFLILNFAQVRQAIAISFILLGVGSYMRYGNRIRAFSIAAFAPFFQISAMLYLILILMAWIWESLSKSRALLRYSVAVVALLILVSAALIDRYSLLSSVLFSDSAREKLEVYKGTQEGSTAALWLLGAYLGVVAWYIRAYLNTFIGKLAVLSLIMCISMIAFFPDNYVMYSRIYVIACIFQAIAMAFIFASHKGWIHQTFFVTSIVVSIFYFVRIITINIDNYVPYAHIL